MGAATRAGVGADGVGGLPQTSASTLTRLPLPLMYNLTFIANSPPSTSRTTLSTAFSSAPASARTVACW